jgi:hypothetical protein
MERTFVVGDMVSFKLQPYVQTSVAARANYKLAFRYFGPYKIIRKINEVAFELQLPVQVRFIWFSMCRNLSRLWV